MVKSLVQKPRNNTFKMQTLQLYESKRKKRLKLCFRVLAPKMKNKI